MTYENVAVPPEWTNLAILNYSIEVMVSDGTSSSSYQPDEGYPEPVSTEDEGEDVPCECGGRQWLSEQFRFSLSGGRQR